MLLFRSIHLCTNCPAWVNNKSLDKEPTARHVAPILSVLDRPLVRPNLVGAQYTLQAWAPESIPDLYVTFYDPCMCRRLFRYNVHSESMLCEIYQLYFAYCRPRGNLIPSSVNLNISQHRHYQRSYYFKGDIVACRVRRSGAQSMG